MNLTCPFVIGGCGQLIFDLTDSIPLIEVFFGVDIEISIAELIVPQVEPVQVIIVGADGGGQFHLHPPQ